MKETLLDGLLSDGVTPNVVYGNGLIQASGSGSQFGGFVGINNGIIQDFNFTFQNQIHAINLTASSIVGGVIGENAGTFDNVTLDASVSVVGQSIVGGLIGISQAGTITNVSNFANVSGNSLVGGLIGQNFSTLDGLNSFNGGQVSAIQSNPQIFGSIVGEKSRYVK